MFSLEELFCAVDDFCQRFEPVWQRQLLSSGLQERNRERSLCPVRNHDDSDWVSSTALSHVQTLLPGASVWLLAGSVSRACELQPFCELDVLSVATIVRLSQALLRQMQWHQLS
jgi:hypothetical protein